LTIEFNAEFALRLDCAQAAVDQDGDENDYRDNGGEYPPLPHGNLQFASVAPHSDNERILPDAGRTSVR
jgi:hypothetical protein